MNERLESQWRREDAQDLKEVKVQDAARDQAISHQARREELYIKVVQVVCQNSTGIDDPGKWALQAVKDFDDLFN